MNANPHYDNAAQALDFLEDSRGSYVDPTTQALTTAQVEATLAVAYEQRTANLITLMGWMATQGATSKAVAKQIDERMGL